MTRKDPAKMLAAMKKEFNPPDKNCISLPDGSCVSTEPCMHWPERGPPAVEEASDDRSPMAEEEINFHVFNSLHHYLTDTCHRYPVLQSDGSSTSEKVLVGSYYGYNIVDRDGNPWWDEACVSHEPGAMQEQADNLNKYSEDDDPIPYRVVRLLYQEMEG